MLSFLRLCGVLLLAAFLVVVPAQEQNAHANTTSYVYGIDDANVIYEIDPVGKTFEVVNPTGLSGTNNSNSMAYDTSRDHFYFMHTYSGGSNNGQTWLLMWDRSTTGPGSLRQIANASQLGISNGADPANAAFYNGAFWFFASSSSNVLKEARLTYTGNIPSFNSLINHDLSTFAAPTYPTGGYGDIAISPTGELYGSQTNGRIFKVDLNLLGNTSNVVYTQIKAADNTFGYQLSFDASHTRLFGHYYNNASWVTIDMTSGSVTSLNFQTPTPPTTTGFRDIGGASDTQSPGLLSLDKTVTSSGPYTLGSTITWRLVATNVGQSDLTNISISENLPGAALSSCSPAAPATLTAGASMTCTATYRVTQADVDNGQVSNGATAVGISGGTTVSDEATSVVIIEKTLAKTGNSSSIDSYFFAGLALTIGAALVLHRARKIRKESPRQ